MFLTLAVLSCLSLTSCREEVQIRQIRVAKQSETPPAAPSGDQVWFFKLTTKSELFTQFSNDFARMVIGTDLSDNIPKYDLPANWTATNGPAPVYQTIKVADNDAAAVITVTPLPAPASDPTGYLKSNIDRWRRQLGLEPLADENWLNKAMQESEIVSIPKGDQFISLVHLNGSTERHGATEMLVAMISDQSLTGTAAMAPSASSAASQSQVEYKLPEGWGESQGNAMRLVSLAVKHDSGVADISVIRLPGGGDVLPNINRWRGQVKLEPVEETELSKSLSDVEVDGFPGKLTLLKGPEESILAAIVEQDDVKWFFKMQGPTAAVVAEQEHFAEFLESVKLNIKSE